MRYKLTKGMLLQDPTNNVIKQESRAAARKPRDAASVLFC